MTEYKHIHTRARFVKNIQKGGKSSHDSSRKTYFQCRGNYNPSKDCPAKGEECNKCQKQVRFERCCRSKIRSKSSEKPSTEMTNSPSFLEFNSDDSFDVFALGTLFEDNECSNQENNNSQSNSPYSVDHIPSLKL